MNDDYEQKLRDSVGDLLAQVAAGEISEEEAQRELDIGRVLAQMLAMTADLVAEMGVPVSPAERMQLDEKILLLWPEACRRAGIAVIEIPADIAQRIASATGRAS